MRLRKIVTGVLIASTLSLSVPAMADVPESGPSGDLWVGYVLGLAGLGLGVFAVVDTSRSP